MSARSNIRRGRLALLPALAVSMSGLLVGNLAHGAPVVPWLNQPAVARAPATASSTSGTHACSSADLRILAGPAGAYHGMATQEIRFTNVGADACTLTGFPSVQLLPSGEAPQTVGASEAAPQLADARIDLAPGEEAIMLIGAPGVCEAANKPQRKVSKRLQLALPGGGMKALDGVQVDTLCGRATVLQFHPVQNDAPPGPAPAAAASPLRQLAATLGAPAETARGGTLRYTVTLSNPTANPVSLSACPSYTQTLYVDGREAASTLRLNCAAAGGQIPPRSAVSFEMLAPVPAGLAAGSAKLSWKLEDGPGAGTLIGVR
jgi:hypothetical protein